MNKKRYSFRLFAAILCTLILFSTCTVAFAASGNDSLIIRSAKLEDNNVKIICSNLPYLPAEMSANGEYTVDIDGTDVEVTKSLFGDNEIPVTIVCLFDSSNSNNHARLSLAREIVSGIAGQLRENDNLVVAEIAGKLNMGEPLNDSNAITKAIDAIHVTDENSNLFNGISECIKNMTSSTVYNDNKVLVILSTASNYSNNGKTASEVAGEIGSTRFPVYTVALLKDVDSIENGKTFGNFARASCGGLALSNADEKEYNHIRNDASALEFYEAIWKSIRSSVVLDVAVPLKLQSEGNKNLTVKFGTESQIVLDTVTVSQTNAVKPTADPTDKPSTEPTAEPTTEPIVVDDDKQPDSDMLLTYCIIGAAALIILLLIILLVKKGKKKNKKAEPVIDGGGTKTTFDGDIEDIGHTSIAKPGYLIMFDDIPYGKISKRFDITEGMISSFGRVGQRADNVLNSTDSELSGKHFSIVVSNDEICLRDENSTNGTLVNGIRLRPNVWTKINSGDKIKVGGYEYRLTVRRI